MYTKVKHEKILPGQKAAKFKFQKVIKWGKFYLTFLFNKWTKLNYLLRLLHLEAMYVPYFDLEGGFKIEVRAQVDIKSGEEITIR